MNKNNRIRIIGILVVAILWGILSVFAWIKPSGNISVSERRPLAQMPEVSVSEIVSGDFVEEFEKYTLDQFPMRDFFRKIKSLFNCYVLGQNDNNDIYIEDGYAVKMEYPLNEISINHANEVFNKIYTKYLEGTETKNYISVVPDKNYYLGEKSEHLTIDYYAMFSDVAENNNWARFIDVSDLLNINDYYKTDTHWKQENLVELVNHFSGTMGAGTIKIEDFEVIEMNKPFYGVYYGQAALSMKPDTIKVLTNDVIENCIVTDWETKQQMSVYPESALKSNDLYDIYLGGAKAVLTIENPQITTDKELIIFRDSFGSSFAPLLIPNYSKITLIDVRYINSDYIGNFVEFENQDVLFLYSTSVLNSSFSLK